jgi:hypothetical protein
MPVPTARTDLSTTAASNSPAGSEAIGTNADDYIRAGFKFIRENYDDVLLRATIASPTFTGTVTGPSYTVTGSSVPANGVYLSAANTFAIASNTTVRYSVNSTGGHAFATPSSGTTTVTVSGASLGTTDGNSTEIVSLNYASGNTDRISFIGYRRDNASDWQTAETRIQRVVDSDPHGFIAFGDGGQGTAAGTQGLILGGGNDDAIYIGSDTNVTFVGTATSPDFIETSSRELKENIADATSGALERIQSLAVKEFEFAADESRRKRVGVIAEDVAARYSVEGKGVSLTNVIFDLVKAVQELAAK